MSVFSCELGGEGYVLGSKSRVRLGDPWQNRGRVVVGKTGISVLWQGLASAEQKDEQLTREVRLRSWQSDTTFVSMRRREQKSNRSFTFQRG